MSARSVPMSRPSSGTAEAAPYADGGGLGARTATGTAPGVRRGWTGLAAWARTLPAHAPALLPALAVLLVGSATLAMAWYAVSRAAYVGYLFVALRARARHGAHEDRATQEAAWLGFRRRVSWVMDNDAATFAALAWVTRGTLVLQGPSWAWLAGGAALGVVGLAVRALATASLPAGAYYWRNFFVHEDRAHVSQAGPYRWLSDPMYSVGYLPLYGLALFLASAAALAGAAVAQATMLLVVVPVERRVFAGR